MAFCGAYRYVGNAEDRCESMMDGPWLIDWGCTGCTIIMGQCQTAFLQTFRPKTQEFVPSGFSFSIGEKSTKHARP